MAAGGKYPSGHAGGADEALVADELIATLEERADAENDDFVRDSTLGASPTFASNMATLYAAVATLFARGEFGSDVSVPLANASAADVTAMRCVLTLLVATAGSERAQWLIRLIKAGAPADTLKITPDAIGFPNGVSTTPALAFLEDATTGFSGAGAGTWQWRAGSALGKYLGGPADYGERVFMRLNANRGGDVASATTITAPVNANYFHVTGTTQIDFLTTTNWVDGALIHVVFNGAVTVRHNIGSPPANTAPFSLSGGVNAAYTAGTKASYRWDQSGGATGVWLEQTRLA